MSYFNKHLKDRGFQTNIEKIQLGKEEVKLFGFIKNRETVKMPRELKEKTFLFESQKRKKICSGFTQLLYKIQ